MEDEVKSLKTEIKALNKRLAVLEAREYRRSIYRKFKFLLNVIIIGMIAYGIWYSYDYVTNYIPNQINKTIDNLIPDSFK